MSLSIAVVVAFISKLAVQLRAFGTNELPQVLQYAEATTLGPVGWSADSSCVRSAH
ncbi:hypothetical protein KTD31_29110 [Burkholderia multivorans]|uniref:hypothetical protein n=1 Tax=Burkholderia multivorans TaxID=87883 RepID=UPI001C2451F0|nr:hypothetical protein [Burkholderia multivorans]MBU9205423.1 hypothetical protein [Burkholderia multivorans]MCO8353432.1 hypothetical protein [Burkholderia multivorans]MCO8385691.1 hypothetical protein [Burkholderia multivorans]MCO8406628.1 hypothetical protein [Burkholderia multivorans]MCO8434787.1 hypothetical protein [Burkholderia multivorans]